MKQLNKLLLENKSLCEDKRSDYIAKMKKVFINMYKKKHYEYNDRQMGSIQKENVDTWYNDLIVASDPSIDLRYVTWLMHGFFNDSMFIEDSYKYKESLTLFDKLRNKSSFTDSKDINTYKDIGELMDVLDKYDPETAKSVAQVKFDAKQDVNKVYESNKWLVLIPETHEAACFYGKGTRWCTAARDDSSMFEEYSDQSPLYIIINKITNKKFQFHFSTSQYMDEKDRSINEIEFLGDMEMWKLFSYSYLLSVFDASQIGEADMNHEYETIITGTTLEFIVHYSDIKRRQKYGYLDNGELIEIDDNYMTMVGFNKQSDNVYNISFDTIKDKTLLLDLTLENPETSPELIIAIKELKGIEGY